MFPTEIRTTAIGSGSTSSRIGGILAPQVAYLANIWVSLPLLVMGGSTLFGGLLALCLLPETFGTSMPFTMKDALELGSKKNKSITNEEL